MRIQGALRFQATNKLKKKKLGLTFGNQQYIKYLQIIEPYLLTCSAEIVEQKVHYPP